jgi:hypothetical protein
MAELDITKSRVKGKLDPAPVTLVAVNCDLLEPHLLTWFRNGTPVEVVRITPWMQAQIEAGLMQKV